ncbi:hypothetical protein DRO66_03745 [Candidatus Bathyarchaeota archaeon]|nr:MAG: hypothetical protein DRO66_03745 [Candidatus Bathyarchaeota archaeon]
MAQVKCTREEANAVIVEAFWGFLLAVKEGADFRKSGYFIYHPNEEFAFRFEVQGSCEEGDIDFIVNKYTSDDEKVQ